MAAMGDVELPASVRAFVDAAVATLGPDLRSVVLFGSAAEGRLRATSDVNLMLVLRRFDPARADGLREPLRLAQAAARLAPMFVLEAELAEAAAAFANKFMDIEKRHRVLHGDDPLAAIEIPRAAAVMRLRQVLLNAVMRLRGRYLAQSLHEERLALVVAETAGPLRAAAATLLALEGKPAASPREALERVAGELDGAAFAPALRALSQARETGKLEPGAARAATLALIDLGGRLHARAVALALAA
jgi:predicted nucleotidyltransferase